MINKLMTDKPLNHMIPFLWMHGEAESRLRELISAVHASGIGAICVESRPHPDFLGEKWWRDMDVVLDECKRRNMEVWILDDERFPTGYSAGRAESSEHRVRYLYEAHVDIAGPQTGSSILLNVPNGNRRVRNTDPVISAVAAHRIPGRNMDHSTHINIEPDPVENLINLTPYIDGDVIYWDVPDGLWRIFTITARYGTGSERHDKYINPLVAEGTQILIDTVYEAHYQHYAADFGRTIKGFFSDEPQFGNAYGYHAAIGRFPNMPLPWSDEVLPEMERVLGCDAGGLLPGLWSNIGAGITPRVRQAYMDVITRLYGQNFCTRIGDWCRAHGVEYMGHVIEENNAHARLGAGTGHYFRALWGQDFAGIDIVLNGLIPGIKGGSHAQCAADFEADDDFFYYCLAQLATSLAHLDAKKRGRAMCEIFGAYGWQEGLREMKWLADFMLSRGINLYVPHAFTPKDFPDPDCPPHFYAQGENPQYRYFGLLMDYMNRVCNLISDGRACTEVAVLYHAEAEWASSDIMKTQEIVKLLTQHQIECDIMPADVLIRSEIEAGCIGANEEYRYRALIVPRAELLPGELIERLGEAARAGVRVIFAEAYPRGSLGDAVDVPTALAGCCCLSDAGILAALYGMELRTGVTTSFEPDLKLYPYELHGVKYVLMFNEGIHAPINTRLTLPGTLAPYMYAPYENVARELTYSHVAGNTCIQIELPPYALNVLVLGGEQPELTLAATRHTRRIPVNGFTVSAATATEYPIFTPKPGLDIGNLNRPDGLPHFSGTVRYEGTFDCRAGERLTLNLNEVGETAEVFINGHSVGTRIAPPYVFTIDSGTVEGTNTIAIEVTNTLVYKMHDRFSAWHAIAASGLIGPIEMSGE